MALIDKLTAIANAIRSKSGKTAALTLDEMPTEIAALSAEEQLKASEYPSYIHTEVLEMVNKVRNVQKSDSIIFLAMSDSHYPADQTGTTAYESNKESTMQANQAAKALAYMLDIDFFAHLGDIACGASTTTPDMLQAQIDEFLAYLHEANSDLPVFIAIGNHDNGVYYHKTMTDGNDYIMSNEWMYNNFTAHSASNNTVMGNTAYGGYCYRDFEDKKLRVFLLNTCEESMYYRADKGATLGSQRVWLANALLDLNNKSNAAEWGYIVLSHYPADYGAAMPLSELFKAYVDGGSITISVEDGTSSTVSFAGYNSAKFISQFHGHVHNFITSKLHSYATGSGVQYDAHRICIPNVQFDRENYYTTPIGSYTDINFSESTSYTKTADTANGTSFVVNVINPSEEKIYSFCYGAGYDRTIGYGSITYCSVNHELYNAYSSKNGISSVEYGVSYHETVWVASGCDMQTIRVEMGGVDITSSVVTSDSYGYYINIPSVTGHVAIYAKAQAHPNFTNLVPLSINTDGTDYYVDGDGYDNGMYIGSNDSLTGLTGYTTTGFIPVNEGKKIIRVAGDGISVDTTYTRFAFYNSEFEKIVVLPYSACGKGTYNPTVIEESSTVVTIETNSATNHNGSSGVYMRICTKGDGANLIVTVDEEITYGGNGGGDVEITYAVVQNLTNVVSSNTTSSVTSGGEFVTTLTAASGYTLGSVTVTMGGLNVTASYYANGEIDSPVVTGNIVITASATSSATSYTNLLTSAGYTANTYLSSGNAGSKTGYYTSGFIPCAIGDTLYFENVTFQNGNNYHRVALYDADQNFITNGQFSTSSAQSHITFTFGSDGNIETMEMASNSTYCKQAAYNRFCCSGLDATSVVTANEPIV